MTAVAQNLPSFPLSRPGWGVSGGNSLNSLNSDEGRGMYGPRKTLQRSNSSSSVSSTGSTASTSTVSNAVPPSNGVPAAGNAEVSQWSASAAARKKPPPKAWTGREGAPAAEFARMPQPRPPMPNGGGGLNNVQHPVPPQSAPQGQMARPNGEQGSGQPVLYLLSLNGTFERKTISVPFYPDSLRIGRQTNQKTIPTPSNGFFDSKVLSRQHAEIWADRSGKIWIRDVKSSNGTFVNGTRLSQENRESEPHELQTADHLELGIDIVSEDQKTVVHHKVAAKVEHAGFLSSSSNVMDMNFADLDPASGSMMMQGGVQGALQFRGRAGSNASMAGSNGRMMPAAGQMNAAQANGMYQRPPWITAVTTEFIVKKLHNDMRIARQQAQDLNRTQQFVSTLLSKEDLKDSDKPDGTADKSAVVTNGNTSFSRNDLKNRFSEPPAPPPQQPLPEKPEIPSLKRGITERPKSHPSNASPIRQDNIDQILQLTEQLNIANKRIDSQAALMDALQERLEQECAAREQAEEELAKHMEDADRLSQLDGKAGSATSSSDELLDEAFEPPKEPDLPALELETDADVPMPDADDETLSEAETLNSSPDSAVQSRLDVVVLEMSTLRQQMEEWKARCLAAEKERDESRKTLAEMVEEIRIANAARAAAEARSKARGRSRGKPSVGSQDNATSGDEASADVARTDGAADDEEPALTEAAEKSRSRDSTGVPTLSRQNTITPVTQALSGPATKLAGQGQQLARLAGQGTGTDSVTTASLPYMSALGVVLLGMGLMAYINGWQPQSQRTL